MPYLLVRAVSWSDGPKCVTSLPSWSCSFDPRRAGQNCVCHRSACWSCGRGVLDLLVVGLKVAYEPAESCEQVRYLRVFGIYVGRLGEGL
jgi:hypothetical protein